MAQTISNLNITVIRPGQNDRTVFAADALQDLAANIRDHGLIQPITVRPVGKRYEIVAGERRYRACRSLGWQTVSAIVLDLGDEEAAAIMLAENVARADLDPIDEALAYQARMERYGWSVSDCAARAGVTKTRVDFRVKLLRLRSDLQHLVRTGDLQLGYAQILASQPLDPNRQLLAVTMLRDNPAPQMAWFRRLVNALYEEEAQEALFDLAALTAPVRVIAGASGTEPPRPGKALPPADGDDVAAIIRLQIEFWRDAAKQWGALGQAFPRNECRAAAEALEAALTAIEGLAS